MTSNKNAGGLREGSSEFPPEKNENPWWRWCELRGACTVGTGASYLGVQAEHLFLSQSPFQGGTQTGLEGSPKNSKSQPERQKAKTLGSGSSPFWKWERCWSTKRANSLRNGTDSRY